jgi:hypothetical protein
MLVPGKEGASLPFARALSAPDDDASLLRGVLEAIHAFVLRLDHAQRIRYVGRVHDGLALNQMIGRRVCEFVALEDLQGFEQAIGEALSTGRLCCYLARGAETLQSGTPRHYEGFVVPFDRGDSDDAATSASSRCTPSRTSHVNGGPRTERATARLQSPSPGHRLIYAYGTAMLPAETN